MSAVSGVRDRNLVLACDSMVQRLNTRTKYKGVINILIVLAIYNGRYPTIKNKPANRHYIVQYQSTEVQASFLPDSHYLSNSSPQS